MTTHEEERRFREILAEELVNAGFGVAWARYIVAGNLDSILTTVGDSFFVSAALAAMSRVAAERDGALEEAIESTRTLLIKPVFPAGLECGALVYCICLNGRAIKRAAEPKP